MTSGIKKLEKFLLDLIFPLQCLGCGLEKTILCEPCQKRLPINTMQTCPICERAITLGGVLCSQCKSFSVSPLDQLVVSSDYKNPLLAKMIHSFKYRFITDLAPCLGEVICQALRKNETFLPDFIVPVPLHPRRLRWRGFNQSELLSDYLSLNIAPGIKIETTKKLIVRKKFTSPQMKVRNYQARQENLKNAFSINGSSGFSTKLVKNKKVLLVDDVCTTGSTLFECAKTIRDLNPKKIAAVVLARQS